MPEEWNGKPSGIVHMIAQWSPMGLELIHTDAWDTPEVHPSAAASLTFEPR